MGWFLTGLKIAASVGGVVCNAINTLLGDDVNDLSQASAYKTGDLAWGSKMTSERPEIYCLNVGSVDNVMTFAKTEGESVVTDTLFVEPKKSSVDLYEWMQDYQDNPMNINRAHDPNEQTLGSEISRIISFTTKALVIGTVVKFVGGVNVSFMKQGDDRFLFHVVTNSDSRPAKIDVKLKDDTGNEASFTAASDKVNGAVGTEEDFEVPGGLTFTQGAVRDLTLDIYLTKEQYDSIKMESKKKYPHLYA